MRDRGRRSEGDVKMMNLKFKEIKKGQLFYEGCYGMNAEMVALEDAHISGKFGERDQYALKARNTQTGEAANYLMTEGLSSYGPQLYATPAYVKMVGPDRDIVFSLLGGPDLDLDDPAQKSLREPELLQAWLDAGVNISVRDWSLGVRAETIRGKILKDFPDEDALIERLDDMVHDAAAKVSVDEVNSLSDDADHDAEIDKTFSAASDACNGGTCAQIEFLLRSGLSEEDILQEIRNNLRLETPGI